MKLVCRNQKFNATNRLQNIVTELQESETYIPSTKDLRWDKACFTTAFKTIFKRSLRNTSPTMSFGRRKFVLTQNKFLYHTVLNMGKCNQSEVFPCICKEFKKHFFFLFNISTSSRQLFPNWYQMHLILSWFFKISFLIIVLNLGHKGKEGTLTSSRKQMPSFFDYGFNDNVLKSTA